MALSNRTSVLLATAAAFVISTFGPSDRVRMLVVPGAELTLVAESLLRRLRLSWQSSAIFMIGVGGAPSGTTRGVVPLHLQSIYSEQRLSVTAHILTRVTNTLPSFQSSHSVWTHLAGLQLADPDYITPGPIDLILGADAYGRLVERALLKGSDSEPIAQRTILSWVVLGPVEPPHSGPHLITYHDTQTLRELLTNFGVQEEVPTATHAQRSPEEEECEQHFVTTHSRDRSGRYTVRLPVLAAARPLGESRTGAQRGLARTLRKLARDERYGSIYTAFLAEYEQLGHMRRILVRGSEPSTACYLPHHGVLRKGSLTTKLRVVFNGSSLTSTGLSLNEILHTGARLQADISDVLLEVRRHRYLFAADITKMFRQIRVNRKDWDLQRILWVNTHGNTVPYHLTTVTYGTRLAPFLAGRVLQQLVKDEGGAYPLAVPALTQGRYVDDLYGGADTLEELSDIARQLRGIYGGRVPIGKLAN